MALRGERFELNLDPEDAYLQQQQSARGHQQASQHGIAAGFGDGFGVKDVLERDPASTRAPEPPKMKQTSTGFPLHKKRTGPSRFKQRREHAQDGVQAPSQKKPSENTFLGSIASASVDEKKSIDQQNEDLIANMSPEELEEARRELTSESSVGIIQRLLNRSRVSGPSEPEEAAPMQDPPLSSEPNIDQAPSALKEVVAVENAPRVKPSSKPSPVAYDENTRPMVPIDLQPVTSASKPSRTPLYAAKYGQPVSNPSHPPLQSQPTTLQPPPALDPNSASFLSDLHSTYFPNLPSDPSHLAWMAPLDPLSERTTASSALDDLTPAEMLRFDMRGAIVPASKSGDVPVTRGLHHHGKDPSAAGYTVEELAIYARSSAAPQRCFAYQLLGRVLFRLGRGDFGAGADGQRSDGLWREVRRGHVLETILKEAARNPGTGNESARVWAVEAVWLWRKGGGKGLDDVEVEEENLMGEAAAQVLEEGLNPP